MSNWEYKHTLVDARDGKWPSGGLKMIENGGRYSWDHMMENDFAISSIHSSMFEGSIFEELEHMEI
ncbi:hypothetical protein QJS10_CPA09g00221 [Acorus calamus]|uniref:Uncharacterized protein n=1 Tax=Acorus calamus TaxID=4465 RepID=A0AAV9E5I7_ACOCL|nr:hypothetical protein QJS10_CPA09g00221 [Acorus calamus]